MEGFSRNVDHRTEESGSRGTFVCICHIEAVRSHVQRILFVDHSYRLCNLTCNGRVLFSVNHSYRDCALSFDLVVCAGSVLFVDNPQRCARISCEATILFVDHSSRLCEFMCTWFCVQV